MGKAEESRYREALEEIVRLATTPDTAAVGTTAGGAISRLWTTEGREKALERAIEVAQEALASD